MIIFLSWTGYWICIALSTVSYYVLLYLFVFRVNPSRWSLRLHAKDDVKSGEESLVEASVVEKSFGREFATGQVLNSEMKSVETATPDESIDSDILVVPDATFPLDFQASLMYYAMDEINAFFEAQKRSKAVRGEVLFALQQLLQKYGSLAASDYKESISNVIKTQCKAVCSISLSDDEVKGVWCV